MRKVVSLMVVGLLALGGLGLSQELGTRARPIIWLLPPSVLPATIQEVAGEIARDLSELTGLYIEPVVAADYAALIETMIVAREDTMACPTTDQYCQITMRNSNVHARLAAVRYGYPYYFCSVYALREKGYDSLEDLAGTVWIYNDPGSTSGYKIPKMQFDLLGLTFAGTVESGGHTNSLIALVEGQGDFCTSYGSAPIPPAWVSEVLPGWRWEYGMYPELWLWDPESETLPTEFYRGRCVDLRHALAATELYGDIWEIVEQVGIVDNIGPMPNDCFAFCEGFPGELEDQIVQAVIEHIHTPRGHELWNNPNFYEWDDVAEIDDSFYDSYRELMGYPIPERG